MSPLAHLECLFLHGQHYFKVCGTSGICSLAGSSWSLGTSHCSVLVVSSLLPGMCNVDEPLFHASAAPSGFSPWWDKSLETMSPNKPFLLYRISLEAC